MVEDSAGYLWVATKDGLNRYDGSRFKVFRLNHSDPTSISDNFVYSLLIDSKNRLWAGTQSAGVNLYNPKTESFIRFGGDRLGSKYIGGLMEDGQGNIVVQTLDEQGFHVIMMSEVQDEYPDPHQVAVRSIREVFPVFDSMHRGKDHSQFLHFDAHGGLWYFNADTIYYSKVDKIKGEGLPTQFTGLISMEHYHRQASIFIETGDGRFYITDWNKNFYRFNYDSETFELMFTLPEDKVFLEDQLIDSKNRLWTVGENGDVFRVDLGTGHFETLSPHWSRFPVDMTDIHTGLNIEDQNGNLWMGTGGMGLLKISGKVDRFKVIDPSIATIVESCRTFKTVRTGGGSWYDPDVAKLISPIFADPIGTFGLKGSFRFAAANSHATIDQDGNLWSSGHNSEFEFLCKVDLKNRTLEKVLTTVQEEHEWFALPVFLDAKDNIWFSEKYSDDGVYLYQYDKGIDSLHAFRFPIDKGKFKYRFVSDWHISKTGTIWLGTMKGVFGFDPITHNWQHFPSDPSDPDRLSSDLVLSVCPDPISSDSILWVGTEGGGLNRLNINTGAVKRFDDKSGLPNNVVYCIQADTRNNIWLSTNFGLCQFNTQTFSTQNFNTWDGLPHNEFNRYEYSRTEDDMLYFGSMGGVVYFNPEDFYGNGKEHRAIINRLIMVNKEVDYGDVNSSYDLPAPIERCTELTFGHDADMISFGFSILDLTSPQKNRFRYQMEGLSNEWIETASNGIATFTDLSPGIYTLKVVGCGSDNVWSTIPTELRIIVLAPWYATWWFRVLMLAAFLGWTYLFYRYRLQQLLRIERMRNRIAQDLHDEIGSTLSSISLYSSVLRQKMTTADDNAEKLLDRISESTSQMMESMNDMVWTIKADNDRFEHVVNRMRAYAVNNAEAKGVELSFEVGAGIEKLNMDMDSRKNVYLVFKEAVNNSIKYARASHLWIRVELIDSRLLVEVKDNGIGFNEEEVSNNYLNMGGNGLRGMRKRASEINGEVVIRSDNGTIIQLLINV